MYTQQQLSLADAKTIAQGAEVKATQEGWNVVIAIVDNGGNLLYLQRMDNTQLGSITVAQEKALTSLRFKRPSKAIEDSIAGGRIVMLTLPGATPIEGGLPIMVQDQVVGAIGVSGVQSSQDAEIATAGIQQWLHSISK